MGADAVRPHLGFLVDHLYAVAFVVAAIDSTGLPFPGRLLLIIAGAYSAGAPGATWVILFAAAGAVVGDHAPYLLGWLGGDGLLSFYCRWTMGSGGCIRKTQEYFRRFGALTILIGRFAAGVRIFAAALAGTGVIPYYQFLLFEILGAFVWAAALILLGYAFGDLAVGLIERYGGVALLTGLAVATLVGIVIVRLLKRRRHGPATVARHARRAS
jgi:membrane protein DedA with SNARE-associated domain